MRMTNQKNLHKLKVNEDYSVHVASFCAHKTFVFTFSMVSLQ